MQIYKENNMSMMGGMGCLPLLLQLPIMMGIYQAVVYSKDLFSASFFGIALGKPSMILTIVATLLYLAQGYMMTIGVPEDQKKMMRTTMMMSPLMTFFISFSAPAAWRFTSWSAELSPSSNRPSSHSSLCQELSVTWTAS